ncbi:MAG: FadR family transcriptional regulator [Muriicola sp.]|nr:FadR family transcriptional regulator [Muriicola sp.]
MKFEVLSKDTIDDVQKGIITKLKDFIEFKNLEPGDKLPSERMLSEKFGVSRSNLREAIQKLEFFGILKSKPQSGTFIANIGRVAMSGMLEDILRLESPDFKSLVETRILLELKTVRLASLRRTEDDLKEMRQTLDAYTTKVLNGQDAVQEDLLFHLAIAQACKNSTLITFMLKITPEIITNFEKYHVCDADMAKRGIGEHEEIYKAVEEQNPKMAKEKMKAHFRLLYQYCYNTE